jgi:pSer/pThr/pTyr-binding forkhead associated (FHA) protein
MSMQDPASKAMPTAPPGGPSGPGAPNAIGGKSFVLKFISGKYQGGEFQLVPEKEFVVGRSSDLDMVLVEDMVSRKHAKIQCDRDQIWIEDLGSTNGTFVNGEKIKRARLKEGDRVLLGTSILKLVTTDGQEEAQRAVDAKPKAPLEPYNSERRGGGGQTRTMSGSIEEIPLPDLLQLLGTSKKNGVLCITTDHDTGKIFLRKGTVYFAIINDLTDVAPAKSLYRMLAWEKGIFDFEPPDPTEFPNEVDMSVQEILMEGLRQLDEFNLAKEKLPAMHARVSIPYPLGGNLRELSKEELDIFQVALVDGDLQSVFNRSPVTDLTTAASLVKLFKNGFLQAEE